MKISLILLIALCVIYMNNIDSRKSKKWGSLPCSKTKPANTPINLITGGNGDCTASLTSDLVKRDNLASNWTDCNYVDTWGPFSVLLPQATIPSNCVSNSTQWQQNRATAVANYLIGKGWNYCHHHNPLWLPPKNDDPKNVNNIQFRVGIDPNSIASGSDSGTCSNAGFPNGTADPTQDAGWTGLDCTHFTSLVYNYAFGAFLEPKTGMQACDPSIPGVILNLNASQQDQFLPGDILYIAAGSSYPRTISHGVIWTGYTVDWNNQTSPFYYKTLLNRLNTGQQAAASKYFTANPNSKIYIIADSHFAGPNYRPFIGWYSSAFTHARRLINTNQIPSNLIGFPSGTAMNYNATSGDCKVTKTSRRLKKKK